MNIELIRASVEDAQEIWELQVKSFIGLLDKYQDFETSPASEPVDKVADRIRQEETYYYFICADGVKVGAIRVFVHPTARYKKISPLFVLPEYQNRGIAQKAMQMCEEIHGVENWRLDTILQEAGNCYLYEKMGYRRTGRTEVINDRLTLVFYEK